MMEAGKIEIVVNGEAIAVPADLSVSGLIDHLELPEKRLAIELNLNIVPRANWQATRLQPGDKLEIVQFVGGG